MTPRITKQAGRKLAESAFHREADRHLTPEHLALWRQGRAGQYDMVPQAGEWEPIVGHVPDPKLYHEYGFMVLDERQGGMVLACRALVNRDESDPSVMLDWYPSRTDPRKRPS